LLFCAALNEQYFYKLGNKFFFFFKFKAAYLYSWPILGPVILEVTTWR